MKHLNDQEILKLLRSADQAEINYGLKELYRGYFQSVKSFVFNNSGNYDDATDVFQNCIIVFYQQVRNEQLKLTCSIKTYLYSICRNIWFKDLRAGKRTTHLSDTYESIEISEDQFKVLLKTEKSLVISKLLDRLGGKCRDLLLLYYYEKLRMNEIVDRMDFSSAQVAKNKKSSCMKKLRSMVAESEVYQNLLR